MGRPLMDTTKEPFERMPDVPVQFGDFGTVSYGDEDPVTKANRKKLSEEEIRVGVAVEGKEYTRVKELGQGYELRKFPPYQFWRCFKDGIQIETLGNYTDLTRAEEALQAYKETK